MCVYLFVFVAYSDRSERNKLIKSAIVAKHHRDMRSSSILLPSVPRILGKFPMV